MGIKHIFSTICSTIATEMWISGQKNCQKLTKSTISQFAIFQKRAALKRIDLNQRSIFFHEIFRINVKVIFDLMFLTGILI